MTTLTTEVVDTGQKRDTRGRRIVLAEERAALIAAYEHSGLTQKAFAKREGVKPCTFTAWLYRWRQRPARERKVAFAEVKLGGGQMPGVIEVVLPDGVAVRGSDPGQIAAMVQRLRQC